MKRKYAALLLLLLVQPSFADSDNEQRPPEVPITLPRATCTHSTQFSIDGKIQSSSKVTRKLEIITLTPNAEEGFKVNVARYPISFGTNFVASYGHFTPSKMTRNKTPLIRAQGDVSVPKKNAGTERTQTKIYLLPQRLLVIQKVDLDRIGGPDEHRFSGVDCQLGQTLTEDELLRLSAIGNMSNDEDLLIDYGLPAL